MRFHLAAAVAAIALSPIMARAQCVGGTINNCPSAISPQPSDVLLGWQFGQNPHTRSFTLQQISSAGPALAFSSPPPIGDVAPNTGAFTALNVTGATTLAGGTLNGSYAGNPTLSGNVAIGGTLGVTGLLTAINQVLIGTGTLAGTPYQFQSAINFDPSAGPAASRQTMFNTTLNYAGTTTNVWEGLTAFTTVNGPGVANGEINQIHAFQLVSAGATTSNTEGFEESSFNNGAITGSRQSYLSLAHNFPTGTAANYIGLNCQLVNDNTTPGSVVTRACLNFNPMTGAGSAPTFNLVIRNGDPTGVIDTLGQVMIGFIAAPNAGILTEIHGLGATSASYSLVVKNSSALNLISARDDGQIIFGTGVTFAQSGVLLTLSGPDNSGGTFPLSIRNLAGASLLAVNDANQTTIAGATTISPTGVLVNIAGPDNSSGTFPLSIRNLAGGSAILSAADNGEVVVGKAGVQFDPQSLAAAETIQGIDNSSGTIALSIKNLAAATVFLVNNAGGITGGAAGQTFNLAGAFAATQNIQTSGGVFVAGSSPGVNCPAGVTAATVVVVGGIVTHC